jgi:hypothetical protein
MGGYALYSENDTLTMIWHSAALRYLDWAIRVPVANLGYLEDTQYGAWA